MRHSTRWVLVAAVALVLALGAAAMLAPTVEAARCICPKVYAPVECDNGKTYPNQCVADCRNAQNCVPVGP